MKVCSKCGKYCDDANAFCDYCGSNEFVQAVTPVDHQPQQVLEPSVQQVCPEQQAPQFQSVPPVQPIYVPQMPVLEPEKSKDQGITSLGSIIICLIFSLFMVSNITGIPSLILSIISLIKRDEYPREKLSTFMKIAWGIVIATAVLIFLVVSFVLILTAIGVSLE